MSKVQSGPSEVRTKIKLPPVKPPGSEILQPKRRHLETIESQRILLIIDDAIRNLNLIAAFDTIMGDLEDFGFLLGQQLYRLFARFRPVFDQYSSVCVQLMRARGELTQGCLDLETESANDTFEVPADFWTMPLDQLKKLDERSSVSVASQRKLTELDAEEIVENVPALVEKKRKMAPLVHFYVRSILIGFRNNPIATQCVLNHKDVWRIRRNVSVSRLIDLMCQLRQIIFDRLITSAQERDEKARFIASVVKKEKDHQTVISELRATLEQMKMEKEIMVSKMNFEIIDLQKDIYKMEVDGKNEIHKILIKSEAEMESIKLAHEENKTKLLNDLNELKVRFNELVEKNKNNELDIRRRKWKLETETENWINKYDNEMSEYQMQHDKLKSEYDAQKESLEELQKVFEPLEKEYLQVLEEQRIAKEKREAERAENEALVYWATVIQSFWRAWKARKAMRKNRRR